MKPSVEEQGCISLVPLMYAIYKTVGGCSGVLGVGGTQHKINTRHLKTGFNKMLWYIQACSNMQPTSERLIAWMNNDKFTF